MLILLETRQRLDGVFDDWSDIDDIREKHDLTPVADAYRSINRTIDHLGGPTMEAVYMLQNHVFADIPDHVNKPSKISSAVFQHCATVAARWPASFHEGL